MDTPAPLNPNTEYVNNPFFIATKGINKLFLNAQGVAIMLVIVSVLGAIPNLGGRGGESSGTVSADKLPPIEVIVGFAALGLVGLALLLFVSTMIAGMSAYAAANVTLGKNVTFKEAFKAALSHFWSFLWLQLLTGLKVLAWGLLFIVPGIIMAFRYSLANIAFFDKGLRGNAAIQESLQLTKGSLTTTLGGQILFNIVTFGILGELVNTSTRAILYRQFTTTPFGARPRAHGLSIAAMILFFVTIGVLVAGLFFLIGAGINYAQSQTF